MIKLISDKQFELSVSDPWDFVTNYGAGPFRMLGIAISDDQRSMLVRLAPTLTIESDILEYFLVQMRYDKSQIELSMNSVMHCNVIHIETGKVDFNNLNQMNKWRGGMMLIGGVRLVS